jgi:hypothetical protein
MSRAESENEGGSRRNFIAHPLTGVREAFRQGGISLLGISFDTVPSGFRGVLGIRELLI